MKSTQTKILCFLSLFCFFCVRCTWQLSVEEEWTSRVSQASSSRLFPRCVPSFFSRQGLNIPTARRVFFTRRLPPRPPPLSPFSKPAAHMLCGCENSLIVGGHYPSGCDKRYPRKIVYPGVLDFYRELDLGVNGPSEWPSNQVRRGEWRV